MEPEDGELVARRDDHRRDRALEALRLVHRDVWDLVVLQESDGPFRVLLVEPASMPELDRDRKRDPLAGLEDELARLVRGKNPFRELDEDRAHLARVCQRLERLAEVLVDLVEKVGRQI